MNIVFLDAYTLNPDEIIDWSVLKSYGELTLHDRVFKEDIIEIAKDADIILTNKAPLNAQTISQLPNLKMICVMATGYNIVDVEFAKQKGISVSNIPSYSSAAVAQHTFALILELTNRIGKFDEKVRNYWTSSPDFCYDHQHIIDLENKTLGLIGIGDIGKKVAKIAQSFGMKVIANSKSMQAFEGIEMKTRESIFVESDIISLHCPLTPATNQLISKQNLAKMKPTAFIINTARGGLIDENALAEALINKTIAGAALDVLSVEPPSALNPLIAAPNCIITPHVAWGSLESRKKLIKIGEQNVIAFLNGKPINVVNK
jgi:glycerate dehydrogenase